MIKPFSEMQYHANSEQLVNILIAKTQQHDPSFFRIRVAHDFCKAASMMRTQIQTHGRGIIPVNCYAQNFAPSGFSKTLAANIIEEQVMVDFNQQFINHTYPQIASEKLDELAIQRAAALHTEYADERKKIEAEYKRSGELVSSFDSGTTPAVKQYRNHLIMSNCGSLNLEVDEIGSNLATNAEILPTFLELFDVGKTRQKLIKSTQDNSRAKEVLGRTPANVMMYGTPAKVFDGGKTEDEYYDYLEEGFGRRCFFGIALPSTKRQLTAEELYQLSNDPRVDNHLTQLRQLFAQRAETAHYGRVLTMSKDVALFFLEYRIWCENAAEDLPEHAEIYRAELLHRHFKATKLAGAYAFVDNTHEITMAQAEAAVKLSQDSGEALSRILKRDKNYVKIAKYLASVDNEVTQADITEDLPCYRGSAAQKNDLITLATAWGVKNNILIKRSNVDGIEFFRGETLQSTELDQLIVSISNHIAYGYQNSIVTWSQLDQLGQHSEFHFANHHFQDGHRCDKNVITGFNLVMIDVDDSVSLATAKLLLKDYQYFIYTTKRHQTEGYGDRFRLIMPTNYVMHLNSDDYTKFMHNIYAWLPFPVDTATSDRPRKWMTHQGEIHSNTGKLLDVLPFIPKTRKEENYRAQLMDQQALSQLERWFVYQAVPGNRNNLMIRYGLLLVDQGLSYEDIHQAVLHLNEKIQDPIPSSEIEITIMKSVAQKIAQMGGASGTA